MKNNKICRSSALLGLVSFLVGAAILPVHADTPDNKALVVTTKPLSELLIVAKNSAPATVVSLNHATLSAEITGKVNKLHVRVGDSVSKGDALVDIDCSDYKLAEKQAVAGLKAANAQEELAVKQYTRNRQLRDSKTIPQSLMDESVLQTQVTRADIAVKKAALEQARLAIERCKITAPFTGQITERMASLGQLLVPNMPVVRLLQTDALEIKADLTPADIQVAKNAKTLQFQYAGVNVSTDFRAVLQSLQESSRTQEVRLVPRHISHLVAGYSGRLRWQGARGLLPAEYLVMRDGQLGVMLHDKGKAIFHILPDAKEGQPAVINLPTDTQIIDLNRFTVKVGQAIKIK